MKSKIIIFIFSFFLSNILFAENVSIESKKISIDKNKQISIFENDVIVTTEEQNQIKSDYAEHNKLSGVIKFKKNVQAVDFKNNIIETDYAEYNENLKILNSVGPTRIVTSEQYIIEGSDITFDNKQNFIKSNNYTTITDQEENKIFLDEFEYLINENIFKSVGFVKIVDKFSNTYEFSQIYIDTKKKEILGTESKAFINHEKMKIDKNNKPRIFSNALNISKDKTIFHKSISTMCGYRKNDKCPPWSIQASKMLHDNKKKTIYYDNAVIKLFDIPIFYTPKISHPDPSVKRRSGLMPPLFSNSKNLGFSTTVPYFFAVNDDKNFTVTSKLFNSEHPLFLGEYHQVFKDSSLFADFGYTKGFKRKTEKKKLGDKSHFFSKFVKNFEGKNNSLNTLNLSVQNVSDKKYFKLYKLNTDLVTSSTEVLENTIDFSHQNDDFFFNINTSIFESLEDNPSDKYEYIYPEINIDKNLVSNEKIGNIDLQTNLKVRNYNTNSTEKFFVNDLNWDIHETEFKSGLNGKLSSTIKNINYKVKNSPNNQYKVDEVSELHGALGYLTELSLRKSSNIGNHLLTPKALFRYAPGSMRKETDHGTRLTPSKAFKLNRNENIYNFEKGLSSTVGIDYKLDNNKQSFDFSVAQIINEKENKKMHKVTGLDEKLSDLVGEAEFGINDNFNINYSFSVDQNYNDLNYSGFGTSMNFDKINFDFNYLQEQKHIGDKEYFTSKVNYNKNNGLFSYEAKRNLVTDSFEFYNLSYEYFNDCLRAGLVYRREFYKDSELEPEDSLMFQITLVPFGKINSPNLGQ